MDSSGVVDLLESETGVFITGSAGTGKSYSVREWLNSTRKRVAVTATTGVAALQIQGETLHRMTGIGNQARPEAAKTIIRQWHARAQADGRAADRLELLRAIDSLVVDEASMLRRDTFELVDSVLRALRHDNRPFGGIQLVLVGDFFQLPPVVTRDDARNYPDLSRPYCFQSKIWDGSGLETVELTKNWRQDDPLFNEILAGVRHGLVDERARVAFNECLGRRPPSGVRPVKLFPHKVSVQEENLVELIKLPGRERVIEAEFWGSAGWGEALKREMTCEERLRIKPGSQVMMLVNDPEGAWVNGSVGRVIEIADSFIVVELVGGKQVMVDRHTWEKSEQYLDDDGEVQKNVLASVTQWPIKLAYASTIHKIQGATLDMVDADLRECFSPGQAYVALSRVRSLSGLYLRGWSESAIKSDSVVKKFYGLKAAGGEWI